MPFLRPERTKLLAKCPFFLISPRASHQGFLGRALREGFLGRDPGLQSPWPLTAVNRGGALGTDIQSSQKRFSGPLGPGSKKSKKLKKFKKVVLTRLTFLFFFFLLLFFFSTFFGPGAERPREPFFFRFSFFLSGPKARMKEMQAQVSNVNNISTSSDQDSEPIAIGPVQFS